MLKLVKNLKSTKLEIDNETVFEVDNFLSIMECENKSKCNGICTILHDYDFQLEVLGITKKDPVALYNSGRWALFSYDDAIQKRSNEQLILIRDVYLKHYLEDTGMARKICPMYNRDEILNAFKELSYSINIDVSEDYSNIIDQMMAENHSDQSDEQRGEMTVDLSNESIKALGEEIAKRLDKFLKIHG